MTHWDQLQTTQTSAHSNTRPERPFNIHPKLAVEMKHYSAEQLSRYFDRIGLNQNEHSDHATLEFLKVLQRRHILQVPFETMELHYSAEKDISLKPEVLLDKIVSRRRGGYCFELNTFFGMVLQSLGFQTTYVGCRMANRSAEKDQISRWKCISHMAVIVIFKQGRYLVDVGCGIYGPIEPLLLYPGYTAPGLTSQEVKLEFKKLAPDAESPPVWIYSKREGGKDWEEIYAFADAEFFISDFEILSYYTMKASPFTKRVLAQNVYVDADGKTGRYSLLGHELWKLAGAEQETIQKLETEVERIQVLERYFGIFLTDEEKGAIHSSDFKLVM